MHKIVHADFELDLSYYGLSLVEENQWFSDRFYTKFSFPFPVYLTEELIKVFGNFLDHRNAFTQTEFEVTYYLGNKKENAIFEIESQIGFQLEGVVRYGLEEFPNWNTKLKDLNLLNTSVTDIYEHAKTHMWANEQASGYQFPQIHTDKYDQSTPTWSTFEGVINKYVATEDSDPDTPGDQLVVEFPKNTHTATDFANRNIIQPCVYFAYILKIGFEMAGFTLKGDVTTSSLFNRLLLFADVDYFNVVSAFKQNFSKNYPNHTSIDNSRFNYSVYIYDYKVSLKPNTRYKVTGQTNFTKGFGSSSGNPISKIVYKTNMLFFTRGMKTSFVRREIFLEFTTDLEDIDTQEIQFYVEDINANNNYKLFDLLIEEIFVTEGSDPEKIENRNEVNLKEAVPDISFGDFVTICTEWFNLEKVLVGNDIYLNFIENQLNQENAIDLSEKEVLHPFREFNKKKTYALKFKEINQDKWFYDSIYISKDGANVRSSLLIPEDAEEKEIDVIPLPNVFQNGVNTAYNLGNGDNTKIYALLYYQISRPIFGLNLAQSPTEILMPSIYENYHAKWYEFLINSINYKWIFKMYLEQLSAINKKVFAYGRYHVIESMEKTQISDDLFEIEIETKTLK